MNESRRFGWPEWLIVVGFVVSIAVVGIFVVRSIHMVARLRQDEPIRPWMTIPYIARSYRVPADGLYRALNLAPRPRDRRPLSAIARSERRPVQDLINDLHKAIAEARAASPPPAGSAQSTPASPAGPPAGPTPGAAPGGAP